MLLNEASLFVIFTVLLIFVAIQLLLNKKNFIKKIFSSISRGIIALIAVNLTGAVTGVTLPISLLSIGISAIVGIPGVASMIFLKTFL